MSRSHIEGALCVEHTMQSSVSSSLRFRVPVALPVLRKSRNGKTLHWRSQWHPSQITNFDEALGARCRSKSSGLADCLASKQLTGLLQVGNHLPTKLPPTKTSKSTEHKGILYAYYCGSKR